MKEKNQLENMIQETILREGPIPFARFMKMALYYPSLGYYTSERTEIGRKGDYYTSPHLHPLFGAILGRQIEECWSLLDCPGRFSVVEQGAGKGYLALDILDFLKGSELYTCLSYIVIEKNPEVAKFQMKLLGEHAEKCSWKDGLESLDRFSGCLLSNELLDSFPVHLIQMDDGIKEVYVGFEDNNFVEKIGEPSTDSINEYINEFFVSFPQGYRTEINLKIKDWLAEIALRLTEGFVVTIDYGYSASEYYSEERDRGTLLCYHKHQTNENPYQNIGLQDITAHVNFSSLKRWGEAYGLKTIGYTSQGTYLVSMGIDELITERYLGKEDYEFEIAKIKGLIIPGGMGESHQVMIQYKGNRNIQMKGFTVRNKFDNL